MQHSLVTNGKLPSVYIRFKDLGYYVDVPEKNKNEVETVLTSSLCWKMFHFSKKKKFPAVQKLTGCLRPGTMTLVLGPPGCGKSSFMKLIAGKIDKNKKGVTLSGEITYNGVTGDKFVLPKVISHVSQIDLHIAQLSVRETLEFSYRCLQGGEKGFQRLSSVSDEQLLKELASVGKLKVEMTAKILGLTNALDTVVGDELLRGVSGGEKKRVTLGEMMMGEVMGNCLDEISTGLDSAATFDILQALMKLAHVMKRTIVVSLLQPAPEVVALFDDILLLHEGLIAYHGPREKILEYFESLGFYRPPRKDVADFLQEVTTEVGQTYINKDHAGPVPPRTAEEFHSVFEASDIFANNQRLIADPQLTSGEFTADIQETFAMGFWESFKLVLARQLKLTLRDKFFMGANLGQSVMMGLMIGTCFWQLDFLAVTNKMGLLFMATLLLSMGGMAQIPLIQKQRSIFYKHRDANFFPTSVFVAADTVVMFPINVVNTLILASLLYWMVDLTADDGGLRFGKHMILLLNCAQCMGQFFRLVSAVSRTQTDAQPVAGVGIVSFVLFSGFIALEPTIPVAWKWLYQISPIQWTVRALAQNEFLSATYADANQPFAPGVDFGKIFLKAFGMPLEDQFWMCNAIVFGENLLLVILTAMAMHFIRFDDSRGSVRTETSVVEVEARQSAGLPFEPITLVWEDLWYSVDMPGSKKGSNEMLDLLKGVTGYSKPGTMTALMGSSGAGKTTLMDVLAGRKTGGKIKGVIRVNGFEKEQKSFARVSGYVEQMDLHSPASTVREALRFSASLRLPENTTEQDIVAQVESTLDLLELRSISDLVVGTLTTGGLSVEQRKRLTIAVELVANPGLLFLDEPTSGLDAKAAQVVMTGINKIKSSGRTVVCTIHQPSAYLFEMFDQLLLLKRGGQVVYFGPLGEGSADLVGYLEAVPSTPLMHTGSNPATYMLEVIGAGTGGAGGKGGMENPTDFAVLYANSFLKEQHMVDVAALLQPAPGASQLHFDSEYAQPAGAQFKALMRKAVTMYWRTPSYNYSRMFVAALIAAIFGSVFFESPSETESDLRSVVGVVFIAFLFLGFVNCNSVLAVMTQERAVFYRERAANMYGVGVYALAMGLVEIPYVFLSTAIFVNCFYWIVGLNSGAAFVWFWVYVFLFFAMCTYVGQFLATALPNEQVAILAASGFVSMISIFSGFFISPDDIPDFWQFMYFMTPSHYVLEGIIATQWHGDTTQITMETVLGPDGGELTTDAQTAIELIYPSFDYDSRWVNLAVLLVFTCLARYGSYWALKSVNHLKR